MTSSLQKITLTAPDDWHIHLRDEDALQYTVAHAAASFERAIIMPNLVPPVMNAKQAIEYKQRISAHIPKNTNFTPLMVLYLTDKTTRNDILQAKDAGVVACKLYPAGATTNSDSGVTAVKNIHTALEAMQEQRMPLLIHGEVTDNHIDIFDRESVFIETILKPLVDDFPSLKIVMEHITTKNAVDFVKSASNNIAATITAHHLLFNRNDMLAGGIRPHFYCLPILKRNTHQNALIEAATSGNPKFFIGTDSAPHERSKKEAACGCAGSYTAFAAIELYAQAFDRANAIEKLEAFTSFYGADFYNLPRNTQSITLEKKAWQVPDHFEFKQDTIIPIFAGQNLHWRRVAS